MSHLIHLIGPPASGKRTIGQHLAKLVNAVLVDNHLFNDVVFKPYGADGIKPLPQEIMLLAEQVRQIGLQAVRLAPPEINHIFTNYLTQGPSGLATVQTFKDLASARGALYIPIYLQCQEEELFRRLDLPERQERAKLRNPEILRQSLDQHGLLEPPANAFCLETTSLPAHEAAQQIASYIHSQSKESLESLSLLIHKKQP